MQLTNRDIEILQKRSDYFGDEPINEKDKEHLNECISSWNEIIGYSGYKAKLGVYCLLYVLSREVIQFYIENSSKETSNAILEEISKSDYYFKKNMKPKEYNYVNGDVEHLKDRSYFWMTNSLHPIEIYHTFSIDKLHPNALEKLELNDEFKLAMVNLFESETTTKILKESRWLQTVNPHMNFSTLLKKMGEFDWSEINEYLKEDISKTVNENLESFLLKNPKRKLDEMIINLSFSKFIDEGRLEPDGRRMLEIAIKRQLFSQNISKIIKNKNEEKEKMLEVLLDLTTKM